MKISNRFHFLLGTAITLAALALASSCQLNPAPLAPVVPVSIDAARVLPSTPAASAAAASAAAASAAAASAAVASTSTPYFTPTHAPQATFTPAASQTQTAAAATATVPAPGVCTPLIEHSLAELKQVISLGFDPPPVGQDTGHHGVDFAYYRLGERASILGVPIHSALAGRVVAVIPDRAPYGYMVIVESPREALPAGLAALLGVEPGESIYLLYAHMRVPPLPALLEDVDCGQALGEVGNTPPDWSSGPHLHFEGRVGPAGAVFEGMSFYVAGTSQIERDGYTRWRTSGEFRLFDPMLLLEFGLPAP